MVKVPAGDKNKNTPFPYFPFFQNKGLNKRESIKNIDSKANMFKQKSQKYNTLQGIVIEKENFT